jgi:adenylate cyclase
MHGRSEQLGQLIDYLDRARAGIVMIEGEAGSGKSRLLAAMDDAARARGYATIVSSAHPIEQATPYFALRSVLRGLLLGPQHPRGEADDALRRRLEDAFADHPFEPRKALLEDILPLGLVDKGLAPQITGSARRAGIEELAVYLATRISRAGPIVLLIDDGHWIDENSTQVLIALSRHVPRLFVVVASRIPVAEEALRGDRIAELASMRLSLSRLNREAMVDMVCELLDVHNIPSRLANFIQDRSEGLPLYAQQLALSLREQKLIEIDGGRCRVLRSDLAADFPATSLRDLLVSRIDALGPTEQLTAKVASAIGRVFDLEMLREVLPMRKEFSLLNPILEHLVAARILAPDAVASGEVYTFQHILIQEMTYELLSFGHRRDLHKRIAYLLERRYANDLQPHFAELADHWERTEQAEKAIEYRTRAAEVALNGHANENALMHIGRIEDQASRAKLELSITRKSDMARIRGEALHALSRFSEAGEEFARCAALNGIPVPSSAAGFAFSTAREIVRQAIYRCRVIRPTSNSATNDRNRLSARIHTRFAEHAYFMTNALRLVHGTITALNRAERAAAVAETIEASGGLAIGLGTAGRFRLADFYRDRSIALAEREGGFQDQGFARLLASVYSFQAGQWQAANIHSTEGAALCERVGDIFRYQTCRVITAFTNIMTGKYVEAEALLCAFGEDGEYIENIPVRAWVLSGLAVLDMIRGGDPARALARIASAKHDTLHSSELLLCDGLAAAAYLEFGDVSRARQLADAAVANLSRSISTMGIALFSVCAPVEIYLSLAARNRDDQLDFGRANAACKVMRRYAARTRICRPRALRLTGELALARGAQIQGRRLLRRALYEADHLGMPLEQALCHLALSKTVYSGVRQVAHRRTGKKLLEQLSVTPWQAQLPIRGA